MLSDLGCDSDLTSHPGCGVPATISNLSLANQKTSFGSMKPVILSDISSSTAFMNRSTRVSPRPPVIGYRITIEVQEERPDHESRRAVDSCYPREAQEVV